MSGFTICIPKEYLALYHQCYTNTDSVDVLGMKKRIEDHMSKDCTDGEEKGDPDSHQQGENSSYSTTDGQAQQDGNSVVEDESEGDASIMDRADVLFKYILRSFRKYYCKNFNDVTEYRKRKRRVTLKLTLINAMKEF